LKKPARIGGLCFCKDEIFVIAKAGKHPVTDGDFPKFFASVSRFSPQKALVQKNFQKI
jgi:hypothetical protein